MQKQSTTSSIVVSTLPTKYRTIEGITEYAMENGLKVLLFPDDSQSTVTVNLTYLVGSRHEGRGEAGMAHLLEHMLFKGTPETPDTKGALQDKGAFFNATTWYDRTNYFETLPSTPENLEFALRFEADRMLNAFIRKEDLDAEMTVVRNEFEMGENDPVGVLHDQIMSAAYRWHNYGKSTIGNRSDIERVPVDNLKNFYKKYYQPDNAVLIVAGKFDEQQALKLISQYYGTIPKPTRTLDTTHTEEPAQDGAREVRLLRSGDVATVATGYHIPSGSHEDFVPLKILSDILTNEPSGHLYKTLVEKGSASEVFGMTYALYEPGMFLLFVKPKEAKDADKLLSQLIEKVEVDRQGIINEKTLNRAKARMLKSYKLALSNSKDLALKLSESIAQGGFELFFLTRDRVSGVTLKDVERVASTYLIESNRTAGLFIPTKSPVRAQIPARPDLVELINAYKGSEEISSGTQFEATVENIEQSVTRTQISDGIRVAFLPKQTRGNVVHANLIFRYGTEAELAPYNEEMSFIPYMLMRGTKNKSFEEIRDTLDVLQSTVQLSSQPGSTVVNITSDKNHVLDVLSLVSEMLRSPTFNEAEFEIVREREISELEESKSDPQRIGFNELDRLTSPWPKTSIHYVPSTQETITKIKAIKLSTLKTLHEKFYNANHLELSVVGSFDVESMKETLQREFGSWKSKEAYKRITRPFITNLETLNVVPTPDKQMAILAVGTNIEIRDDSDDFPALRFANYVFGESMKSRLMLRLREKEGLSYGAGSMLQPGSHEPNSNLTMYAMASTENAEKALELIKEEWARFIKDGVTKDELAESKISYKARFDNLLANDKFVVGALSSSIELGRTLRFQESLVSNVLRLSEEKIKSVLAKYLQNSPLSQVKAGDFKN